jgi:hypothetical protein
MLCPDPADGPFKSNARYAEGTREMNECRVRRDDPVARSG